MNSTAHAVNIAVLDDYQGVALKLADWSAVAAEPRREVSPRCVLAANSATACITEFTANGSSRFEKST